MIDNDPSNSAFMFKRYFNEIQKRFLSSDEFVSEAAGTALSILFSLDVNILKPYLTEFINLYPLLFSKNNLTSITIIHDITLLLIKSDEEYLKKLPIIEEIINNIIQKIEEKVESREYESVINLLEIANKMIEANAYKINQYIPYMIDLSLTIIQFSLDKNNFNNGFRTDLILQSLNMISNSYKCFPIVMLEYINKKIIKEIFLKLLEIKHNYIKQFVIAVIGEIVQIDDSIFMPYIKDIICILVDSLEINDFSDKENLQKLFLCNNAIWCIGILAITYHRIIHEHVNEIINKIIRLLAFSNINLSLCQNIGICIGRCSLNAPQIASNYLDEFLKHACLFLKNVKNSEEKIEAFRGFCKAIIHNPNGVINHFPFFCDAVSCYDDAPIELELLFKNLIFSYKISLKDKWSNYYNNFPDKLKEKLKEKYDLS